ncbi:hypothetical protein ACLKA6_013423 [Drosophila palustris]
MKSRNTDTGKTTSGLCPTPRDDHWPAQPQQRSTTTISGANGQANCCLQQQQQPQQQQPQQLQQKRRDESVCHSFVIAIDCQRSWQPQLQARAALSLSHAVLLYIHFSIYGQFAIPWNILCQSEL